MRENHCLLLSAVVLAASALSAGAQTVIAHPGDDIIGIGHDLANQWSYGLTADVDYPSGENPANAIDGDLFDKYLTFGGAGLDDNGNQVGNPTGFIVTLSASGASSVSGFRFATGNDFPSRDPSMITIEGGNFGAETSDDIANTDSDADWTLVYSGPTGIALDQARNTYGDYVYFPTSATYSSYRVIITDLVRYPDNAPTVAQFSEIQLVNVPEPATALLFGIGSLWLLRRRRVRAHR